MVVRTVSTSRISWAAACLLGACIAGAWACSDGAPPIVGDSDGGPNNKEDAAPLDPCASPTPGCACTTAGEQADCGTVYRISGNHVDCSPGHLTCETGKWSQCVGASVYDGG
jgi:hypothetical protein